MLSWLLSPTESFASGAEVLSDIGLAVFTVIALVFVAAEYAAEHFNWSWGHERKALFALFVVIGFLGELIFEMGSFRYAYALQGWQTRTISELESKSDKAKSDADKAIKEAGDVKGAADAASATAKGAEQAAQNANNQISGLSDSERRLRSALKADEHTIQYLNLKESARFSINQPSLIKSLKRISPKVPIQIFFETLAPDGKIAALFLDDCLHKAGWTAVTSFAILTDPKLRGRALEDEYLSLGSNSPEGVWISTSFADEKTTVPEIAKELSLAFGEAGGDSGRGPSDVVPKGTIRVLILPKRP